MTRRDYQLGFYSMWEGVRDAAARSRKARKIAYALTTLGAHSLASATCLDIGCASGLITTTLAPLFARIVGIEYDAVALDDVPREQPASLQFVRGDAMQLPVADSVVDVVICAQVYEHVPDDSRLVAEIYRVLRPGGVVFFSGPNKLFPIEPHYFLPILHWLPPDWADGYLRLVRRGDHYYERSRTFWELRRLLSDFVVQDITAALLRAKAESMVPRPWAGIVARIPSFVWHVLSPVLPNFNWILFKPREAGIIAQRSPTP